MKTIAISGVTGMLGSMLYKVFKDKYRLVLIARSDKKINALKRAYGKSKFTKVVFFDFLDIYSDFNKKSINSSTPELLKLVKKIGRVDAFINCAGIINRYSEKNPTATFFINCALPHLLSNIYREKLIHVTTDCVYSGKHNSPYNEKSLPDPTDLYGLTKSLGEPTTNSLVLRSSFIGPEIAGFVSLFEWFKRTENVTIGYTNHLWNGITSKQFAKICLMILSNRKNYPLKGLFHIYSNSVSKYQVLLGFKNLLNKKIRIIPKQVEPIDRRLSSCYNFCDRFGIPKFEKMLADFY